MQQLSGRERLKRVFKRLEVDRMPARIWGTDPLFPKKGWQPLYELTEKHELEIIREWGVPAQNLPPLYVCREEKTVREGMIEYKTVIETLKGNLTRIYSRPADGSPGYCRKHFVESEKEAVIWLAIDFPKAMPSVDAYFELEKRTGARALLMVDLASPFLEVHGLIGSELFAYWVYDAPALLHAMIEKCFKKTEDLVKYYLSLNIGDAYGWGGPELCIPPLASVEAFREFELSYDKKLIDLIHNHGKLVWIHSHGDMSVVLNDFIGAGVDCLNPMEPPPANKITLAEALNICRGKMALDGGVNDNDFDLLSSAEMKCVVERTVSQIGAQDAFILCPTSTPNTSGDKPPTSRRIENYKQFVETAIKMRKYLKA